MQFYEILNFLGLRLVCKSGGRVYVLFCWVLQQDLVILRGAGEASPLKAVPRVGSSCSQSIYPHLQPHIHSVHLPASKLRSSLGLAGRVGLGYLRTQTTAPVRN